MIKSLALIAHDHQKPALLAWVGARQSALKPLTLFATGTTGRQIQAATGLTVQCFQSGPLGGDQQVGSAIVEGRLDGLIFFWDPMSPQPHDPDVKALLRLSVLWNLPVAMNPATADYLVLSPLFCEPYARDLSLVEAYLAAR